MKNYRLNAPVELTVQAEPGMMLVVRLTTAGVVTRAGLTIDAMDNLKIATEEACNCLIGQQTPPERLFLRYACEENALSIRIATGECDDCACEGADETELEIVRCILESLTDHVNFDVCEGRIRAIELRADLM
jgi:serine/threonine-protein kinase RsbW